MTLYTWNKQEGRVNKQAVNVAKGKDHQLVRFSNFALNSTWIYYSKLILASIVKRVQTTLPLS